MTNREQFSPNLPVPVTSGQNARILSLPSHKITQDPVSAHRARQEYAIVTSHDFCLVRGASDGLNAVEERGVRDDQSTIRQRLNNAVRKGKDCSKEEQKTSDPCLPGRYNGERRYGSRGDREQEKSS